MQRQRYASAATAIPLKSLLIANRGEIVHRVARTAKRMGITTTSVYTEPDHLLSHASSSQTNMGLGSSGGYIDMDRIVAAARAAGCDSIHPGYGFLSENAQFARRVRDAGLVFVGPGPAAMEAMGAKDQAKYIMEKAGVPCVPGYHGTDQDTASLQAHARDIGFPVLIKAVLGGGGKGMRIVESEEAFASQLASAQSEAQAAFGDSRVLVEKYIARPRHIEVQVFADRHGNVVALGERDCSVQRRHQKVLEESPAPGLNADTRQQLWDKARAAAQAVGYEGAGTVEFIFDNDTGEFYFMEMNTRLQVEHPVTEFVTGIDLVEWQLLVAAGLPLPLTQDQIQLSGHAIEARIYCEDPFRQFVPSPGPIVHLQRPVSGSPRLDFTFDQGDTVSSLYDPMIGKVIVHGASRTQALMKLHVALTELEIVGPVTNVEFCKNILASSAFGGDSPAALDTGFIANHQAEILHTPQADIYVLAQAAVGELLSSAAHNAFGSSSGWTPLSRTLQFVDGDGVITVTVVEDGSGAFTVRARDQTVKVEHARFTNLSETGFDRTAKLHIRFPDRQYINTVVVQAAGTHVFHEGVHHTLNKHVPQWIEAALGTVEAGHQVTAPMPSVVTRVCVAEGETVTKEQQLLVITSMKMETVIRSPVDAVVKRVVHQPGDVVSQGASLVEFEV